MLCAKRSTVRRKGTDAGKEKFGILIPMPLRVDDRVKGERGKTSAGDEQMVRGERAIGIGEQELELEFKKWGGPDRRGGGGEKRMRAVVRGVRGPETQKAGSVGTSL